LQDISHVVIPNRCSIVRASAALVCVIQLTKSSQSYLAKSLTLLSVKDKLVNFASEAHILLHKGQHEIACLTRAVVPPDACVVKG
jgi:hypothetical protein